MKHYPIEDWADFERGRVSEKTNVAMKNHLATGCKECLKARSMWHTAIELARQEGRYAPPADIVRAAKSSFRLARPEKSSHWLAAMADVVFDSFRQPLAEGVRSSRELARQMLYKYGSTTVHIRVEHEAGGDRYSLVGQILDTKYPEQPVKNVAVRLRTTGEESSKMRTNDFGEFHFEVEALDQVGIEIGRQFRVFVPIAGAKGISASPPKAGNEN